MTRADCQALSKHHHVCWLSIPCPQHKIGGQRIIGVRDGKDIWGQPVHPSAFPCPWFQIIPYIIFLLQLLYSFHGLHSTPAVTFGEWCWRLCPVSPQQREILLLPPVDIRELLCWWSQLRGWRLTGSLSAAWGWGFSRQESAYSVWWCWGRGRGQGTV